jgi:dinuclear metal center YbgI/SA1388 family protein
VTTLRTLVAAIEQRWPVDAAEAWDRAGLIVGSDEQQVQKVMLTVDVTSEVVGEAIASGADLVLSHHPVLLRQSPSIAADVAKSKTFAVAIEGGVAIFAAHTNADITETGVSATLARAAGLADLEPLVPVSQTTGHGRIGRLAEPKTLLEFSRGLAAVLPSTASGVRVAGDPNQVISTVALCAGAGDSFIADALAAGADLYLTSDLRHHPVQEALESAAASSKPFAMVDISHWAAEWLWLETARDELAAEFPQVTFVVSDLRTDPWDFVVTQ